MTDATDAIDAITRHVAGNRWVPSRWCDLCLDHEVLRECRQIAEHMKPNKKRRHRHLLIIGPVNSGKHALANVMARHATCLMPTRFGACGRCQNCRATPFTMADERHPWGLLYAHLHGQNMDKNNVSLLRKRINHHRGHQVILVEGIDRATEGFQRWLTEDWVGVDRCVRWLMTAEDEGLVVRELRSVIGPHLMIPPPDLDLFCGFVEDRFRERGIFIRPALAVNLARQHFRDFARILSIVKAEAERPAG